MMPTSSLPDLTPDTQATLLLCGNFVRGGERVPPLSPREYNAVAKALVEAERRPADLVRGQGLDAVERLGAASPEPARIVALLGRGAALAVALEKWRQLGIWVLGRSDPAYPARLLQRLRGRAAPLLYGAGDPALLDEGGLAIVGSRDAAPGVLDFVRQLSARCAREKICVISGGARGVDREAMGGALEAGGTAVGVLSDGLAAAVVGKRYRDALRERRLLLLSVVAPDAAFNVGNAMARNKYIYALADAALIAQANETGGTWEGAMENLAAAWVPSFVFTGTDAPGNAALLARGAAGLDATAIEAAPSLDRLLRLRMNGRPSPEAARLREDAKVPPSPGPDLYEIFLQALDARLGAEGLTEKSVAETFRLEAKQAKSWLERAVAERRLRKLKRPARYAAAEKTLL